MDEQAFNELVRILQIKNLSSHYLQLNGYWVCLRLFSLLLNFGCDIYITHDFVQLYSEINFAGAGGERNLNICKEQCFPSLEPVLKKLVL